MYLSSSSPTIAGATVSNSATLGIYLTSSSAALSNISIDGFGATSDGISFNSSSGASLSGTNQISGPGANGFSFLSNVGTDAPTFGGMTVAAIVAKLGKGGADYWANLFNSSPTILGSGYEQEVVGSTLSKSSTWGLMGRIASLHLLGDLTIQGVANPVLELTPGTIVKLDQSVSINVGSTQPGGLMAVGPRGSTSAFRRRGRTSGSTSCSTARRSTRRRACSTAI
jgi:parallel beta-helix repeat protein